MTITKWLESPRRTLGLSLAMMIGLAAGVMWLGWQVVELDRNLELQRTRERVSHALDLVVVSLAAWLDEIDRELAVLAAGTDDTSIPTLPPGNADEVPAIAAVITESRTLIRPLRRLAYYDAMADGSSSTRMSVDTGRAVVLLNEAAALKRDGEPDKALAAYDRLSRLPETVLDAPALVVARHARGLLLEALNRTDELGAEAAALLLALADSRHGLTSGALRYYAGDALRWLLSGGEPPSDSVRVVRTVRAGDGTRLIVARATAEGSAAFVASVQILQLKALQVLAGDANQIALAILDGADQLVVGDLPSTVPGRMTRTAVESGLPWTLTAAPTATWTPDPGAVARQRLVLTGVLLVAVAVVVAAWMAGRSMHRELEAARLQSDFVSAVSHEFRTPLAAFGQITELLADGRVADEADRVEYYRRLQHETARLARLIEDLLDFRRMEAGAHEYHFEPVDVESLVRDVADECQPDPGRVAPRIDFAGTRQSLFVRADREALARAVRNLIDNALKYAAGTPVVDVSVSQGQPEVSISVRDTGPGIAPAEHRLIFEKFVRAGGRQSTVRGTGLGLAMVRHIVEAHGGRVHLDSQVGRGSTFTIVLPVGGETMPAAREA